MEWGRAPTASLKMRTTLHIWLLVPDSSPSATSTCEKLLLVAIAAMILSGCSSRQRFSRLRNISVTDPAALLPWEAIAAIASAARVPL